MPTFNNNIPQPTDVLSDSQDDILQNFQQLDAAWNINHEPFNSASPTFLGKHTQVTLPENAAPTVTLANIYSISSPLSGTTELAWQRANNGDVIEWTGLLAAQNGWTRLPSGILLKWGNSGPSIGYTSTLVYPVAASIPVFTNVFITLLVAAPAAPGVDIVANIINGTQTNLQFQFSVFDTNAVGFVSSINYLSIGI
jgi:hypothetical protein